MIVASQSENGQVLHVIPSQPGVAQVIIPQGQLLDVTSSQGKVHRVPTDYVEASSTEISTTCY